MADTARDCHRREEEEGEYEMLERIEEEGEQVEGDVVEGEITTRNPSSSSSSSFLPELNLVMILSFLTLSTHEVSQLDESEKLAVASAGKQREVKALKASKLPSQRRSRECGGFKFADRRSISRSQSRILRSRHGRKM